MASPERRSTLAIEARALGFRYGSRSALDGIDLEVAAGEIVGLAGPNGSGKSTLLRVLSGVLGRYSGSARIDGHEVSSRSPRDLARSIAVVAQDGGFAFPFTALEIALLGRHPHLAGLAFESERDLALARDALERSGVAALAERPIDQLSAGERQRVLFAKALCQEPQVLLLDEAASFLDLRHQVELYDSVRELATEKGVAVLTALHDLNLAAEYCDRLYLLDHGRVDTAGPTDAVLTWANILRVFKTEVYVDVHDLTGKTIVVPLSGRVRARISGARDAPDRGSSSPE